MAWMEDREGAAITGKEALLLDGLKGTDASTGTCLNRRQGRQGFNEASRHLPGRSIAELACLSSVCLDPISHPGVPLEPVPVSE
jgi:hypothetical protein